MQLEQQCNGDASSGGRAPRLRLRPNLAKSYNFREDGPAAEAVFEALQDFVPFVTLGSFAAMQVGITTDDFARWDMGCSELGVPSLGLSLCVCVYVCVCVCE